MDSRRIRFDLVRLWWHIVLGFVSCQSDLEVIRFLRGSFLRLEQLRGNDQESFATTSGGFETPFSGHFFQTCGFPRKVLVQRATRIRLLVVIMDRID